MTAENPRKGLNLDEPLAEGEVLIATGLGTSSVYHTDRDCPRCGDDVTKLGVHLRHCNGVISRA